MRRDAIAEGLLPDPEVAVMLDRVPEQMGGEMPMVRYQVSQMLPWLYRNGRYGGSARGVARAAER